jgi:hypothetical protein
VTSDFQGMMAEIPVLTPFRKEHCVEVVSETSGLIYTKTVETAEMVAEKGALIGTAKYTRKSWIAC